MIYLDTTILVTFAFAKHAAPQRHRQAAELIARISTGTVQAVTSFYALHELFVFAIRNLAPDTAAGSELGKQGLVEILQTKVKVLPMLTRQERTLNQHIFRAFKDSSDVSHAISAHLAGCQALVSFDAHFKSLPPDLPWKTPDEILALPAQNQVPGQAPKR